MKYYEIDDERHEIVIAHLNSFSSHKCTEKGVRQQCLPGIQIVTD